MGGWGVGVPLALCPVDRSLITGRGVWRENRKIASPKLFAPPQDRIKLFCEPVSLKNEFYTECWKEGQALITIHGA